MNHTTRKLPAQAAPAGALLGTLLLAACSQQPANAPATGAADTAGTPATAAPSTAPPVDFSGTWLPDANQETLQSTDGMPIPLNAEGEKLHAAHLAAASRGDRSWDGTGRCIPPGTPRILGIAQPFEIGQDAHQLSMTFQYQRLVRFVALDAVYATNADASFMGDSQGHWDGQTLVIETTRLKAGTLLDASGLPHGKELKLTERLSLADADTLVDDVTFSDPAYYSRDWSARLRFTRLKSGGAGEDVCVERTGIHK
ncbi:MAG: hypothetical protein QM718_06320 [Steroidobacteraceae bacterium]